MSAQPPPSTVLYQYGETRIGMWRCSPDHPQFAGGHIREPTIVFPRTCVRINRPETETVVAEPNVAVLYRGNENYTRDVVDPLGDVCEWFAVDPAWIREAARPYDPDVTDTDAPPMRPAQGATDARTYARQRAIVRALASQDATDPMVVEEHLIQIVNEVIAAAYCRAPSEPTPSAEHRAIVADARSFLATSYRDETTLATVGAAVGSSPFHLARIFRRVTGQTVHRYLTDLRLRASLGLLIDSDLDIAQVALEVGFSSHSHLTARFRRAFGVTPSRYRDDLLT